LRQDARSTSSTESGAQDLALQSTLVGQSLPASLKGEVGCNTLATQVLAELCLRKMDNFQRGEPCTDAYGVELVRRATIQGDQEAWEGMQHCFGGIVRGWLRGHPSREVACRLESEENYVAQTFEHFWQATTLTQHVEFSTLSAVLQYLRASLNGAIVDMLRAYAQPREVSLQEPGAPEEPHMQDTTDGSQLWEILQTMLPNKREQRVAYLLFHGGLKPREIIRFCPQEFRDLHEIYRLHRNILVRLLRNTDQLRWRLTVVEGDR
jgi:hypothetical protein